MRVISKFHDYYDSVMAYDGDRETVYVRDEIVIDCKKAKVTYPFPSFGSYYSYGDTHVDSFSIAFCGKVYNGVRLKMRYSEEDKVCYTIDDVNAFMKEKLNEKQLEAYYTKGGSKYWSWYLTHYSFNKHFNESAESTNNYQFLFDQYKAPIIIGDQRGGFHRDPQIIINGNLKKYEFFRCPYFMKNEDDSLRYFDTYTTYQELSMYVGGVLGSAMKHIPVPDDKTMAEIKGFDHKYSFRKEPKEKS